MLPVLVDALQVSGVALAQRDIRAYEDEITALAFDHARKYRGGQPVCPDQMDLDLRFESLGVDFVQPPEVGIPSAGHEQLDVAQLLGGLVHESLD